jgi:hypothetical protein
VGTLFLVEAAFYLLLVALVFGGTIALGLWAIRSHDRAYPQDRVRVGERERRRSFFETRFTWLSGGRG